MREEHNALRKQSSDYFCHHYGLAGPGRHHDHRRGILFPRVENGGHGGLLVRTENHFFISFGTQVSYRNFPISPRPAQDRHPSPWQIGQRQKGFVAAMAVRMDSRPVMTWEYPISANSGSLASWARSMVVRI